MLMNIIKGNIVDAYFIPVFKPSHAVSEARWYLVPYFKRRGHIYESLMKIRDQAAADCLGPWTNMA